MLLVKKSISVAWEDKAYFVLEKPAGILAVPTLAHIVNQQYVQEGSSRLYLCHRLDRETSGLIIFAKGRHHQQNMMELFKKRAVIKKYIAFVQGHMQRRRGELRSKTQHWEERKFGAHVSAKLAVTRFRVIQNKNQFDVLEVFPLTGRTNQIRIQFSEMGHPLVGERKYAFAKDFSLKFKRVALHACMLEWTHPVTHQRIHLESPLPQDMKGFLEKN